MMGIKDRGCSGVWVDSTKSRGKCLVADTATASMVVVVADSWGCELEFTVVEFDFDVEGMDSNSSLLLAIAVVDEKYRPGLAV